jgi:hypothetical protein
VVVGGGDIRNIGMDDARIAPSADDENENSYPEDNGGPSDSGQEAEKATFADRYQSLETPPFSHLLASHYQQFPLLPDRLRIIPILLSPKLCGLTITLHCNCGCTPPTRKPFTMLSGNSGPQWGIYCSRSQLSVCFRNQGMQAA